MRTIKKQPEPPALAGWRISAKTGSIAGVSYTYGSLRSDKLVLDKLETALLSEQGWLCAYTGRRLRRDNFHIEHLLPQSGGFYPGHDTDYQNMVACWPEPNSAAAPEYGARKKDNWPAPADQHLFISPLSPQCSRVFGFAYSGKIFAKNPSDVAASTTITKLGLDHPTLTVLRKSAIQGALAPRGKALSSVQAKRLLEQINVKTNDLDRGINTELREFVFAIQQQLA